MNKNSIFLKFNTLIYKTYQPLHKEKKMWNNNFEFELTLRPQALFKNDLMRKPDKSSLRKILLTDHRMCSEDDVNGVYVLDGGALLHRVHWIKGTRFKEVILGICNLCPKKLWKLFHCV